MTNTKYYLILLIITSLFYGGALKYGFSQDDWYFLSISQANSLGDILNFFNPAAQSGFAFFRPLGTQLYYYLSTTLAGIESAPILMHSFMILVQAASAIVVYRLLLLLKYSDQLSKYVSLIYASTSAVFLSLYYIAATQQLLATFFSLLSLTAFISRKPLQVGIYWALALLSKETAIMTPVLGVILTQLKELNLSIFKKWQQFIPYFLVGVIYISLRLISPPTVQSEYHFVFGGNVISTLRWFILFGYGSPEEWIRYGLAGGRLNLSGIVSDYGLLGVVNISTTAILLIMTLYSLLTSPHVHRPLLYILWWFLGLAPILFLQNHRYPHYLDLSLIPLLLLTLESIKRYHLAIVGIFLVASYTAITISSSSHWTVGRSKISEKAIEYFAQNQVCETSHLIFAAPAPYPAELGYALSLENGPRVICNNSQLKVEYREDLPVSGGEVLVIDPRLLL